MYRILLQVEYGIYVLPYLSVSRCCHKNLMSFTSTWLNKCVFLSLQEYEIQEENQFGVYDAMCFASVLTTPENSKHCGKNQKTTEDKILKYCKAMQPEFIYCTSYLVGH